MTTIDYLFNLILSAFLIIGVYQFYFWCQRNVGSKTFDLSLGIDERVPYWPSWVWIYSFLYYPMILFIILTIDSPGEFPRIAISYVLLLGLQMIAFRMFPVATPAHWRTRNGCVICRSVSSPLCSALTTVRTASPACIVRSPC